MVLILVPYRISQMKISRFEELAIKIKSKADVVKMASLCAWIDFISFLVNKFHIRMIPFPYEAASLPFSRKQR
jgi:hypothetical protein